MRLAQGLGPVFGGLPLPPLEENASSAVLALAILMRILVAVACRDWIVVPTDLEEDMVVGQHGYAPPRRPLRHR